MVPGAFCGEATEIFHEGLLVPPIRIYREGKLNEEAYRMFLRNSRLPHMVEGDTKAMIASCQLAESRVLELFDRYGQETVLTAFVEVIDMTAARARTLFLELIPESEYRFHDYLDTDGVTGRPYRVALTLRRHGERVELDATETDEQGQGPINYMTHLGLVQMAYGRWLLSLDPTLDVNDGLLRNLDAWITREGSVLQPRFPAPCGMRMHTHYRLVAGIFGTLAKANNGHVPANSPVYVLYYFRTYEPATGQLILCIEGLGVGLGAKPDADGVDGAHGAIPSTYWNGCGRQCKVLAAAARRVRL
jgi:N-methylhydantoinase B